MDGTVRCRQVFYPRMTPLAPTHGETGATLAALEPLQPVARRWPALLGAALTVAMVAGLAWQLFHRGLGELSRSVPESPMFYVCFIAFYMTLPVFDFAIFRRLWKIPATGLIALTKKRIANDVVVNYSGEAYFYSWARANARLVAAPFGAIKDVSILSAIAGNALTLVMILLALPLGRQLMTAGQFHNALWSTGLLVLISVPFLIFSRRVFSLPRRELWVVFALHCVRLVVSNVLIALAWHFAMPEVSLGMWLLLTAGRMLVSRLPLIPNKDVLFPLLANMLIGGRESLVQLLAFGAAVTLAINAAFIVVFAIGSLVTKEKSW